MAITTAKDADGLHHDLFSLSSIRQRADRLLLVLSWVMWAVSLGVGGMNENFTLALIAASILSVLATIMTLLFAGKLLTRLVGNDSNLLIVFYVQIMPDDFVMQLHRF
ncbi:hypothetical protein [Kluyvera intermedia]|uniref:hypothetical protein n=1 Tax=Kluyvera intermedia TaxID=61648 RepID=UPI0039F488E7